MARPRIYLDYNATAPVRSEALAAFTRSAVEGGNASSVHAEGRAARAALETARRDVAALPGARPDGVTFTSGGTEAANLALAPVSLPGRARIDRLLIGATEHVAVTKGHRFGAEAVGTVPVTPDGIVDLGRLASMIRSDAPAMLALQAANNETGVIQPIAAAAALVHAAGGLLVCDAVQAAGRIDCRALGADVVLLSGHKLGGLPGTGAAVVLRDDLAVLPLVRGGSQERGLRAGTENVPAVTAFGVAARIAAEADEGPRLAALRDRFEAALRSLAAEVRIFGETVARLPNTSAFSVPGIEAERLMMLLDLGGIAVSSGAACSSGKVGRSHVLEAMGIEPDLRRGAIRVSFGWRSVEADVDAAVAVLGPALARLAGRPMRSAA
ncbi:MAG TPA: cysteine desulfurase family protein [Lichenihabitans sp.]|jgi:cysteine desulfurase|nr:cysteine desulfurase family protein [Lichenihabitans sp.]